MYERAHPVRLAGFIGARRACCSRRSTAPSSRSCWSAVAALPVVFGLTLLQPAPERRRRWRSRCSGSTGSASRSPTRCCCAACPTGWAIVIDVLVGTFLGDTGAYLGGRMFGRRPLAPRISPEQDRRGPRDRDAVRGAGRVDRRALPGMAARHPRARARPRRRAGGAGRRPVRVVRQARGRHARTRAGCSAPTAARSTASTRCCSRRSSATTSGRRTCTRRALVALRWRSWAIASAHA